MKLFKLFGDRRSGRCSMRLELSKNLFASSVATLSGNGTSRVRVWTGARATKIVTHSFYDALLDSIKSMKWPLTLDPETFETNITNIILFS